MSRGTRHIDGRYYLLNGRWIGVDAQEEARKVAERRRKDGYFVRVVKMGFMDYALYEFPNED
jgi:hypothetical protein